MSSNTFTVVDLRQNDEKSPQTTVSVENGEKLLPPASTDTPAQPPPHSSSEISHHNTVDDMWIIIHGDVYDVTDFQSEHPGGQKVFAPLAGKDATKKFDKYHRRGILEQVKHRKLRVGVLGSQESQDGAEQDLAHTGDTKGARGWLKGKLDKYLH